MPDSVTLTDWLTILAIFLGPVVAVRMTRWLDKRRVAEDRKHEIFKVLMDTRPDAYSLTWQHVQALNRVCLEFNQDNKAEKKIINAWTAYLDRLNRHPGRNAPDALHVEWNTKRKELLVDLLYEMACVLGYDFDKTHIKNAWYAPQAHGDTEEQQNELRKKVLKVFEGVLKGTTSIPIHVKEPSQEDPSQNQPNQREGGKDG